MNGFVVCYYSYKICLGWYTSSDQHGFHMELYDFNQTKKSLLDKGIYNYGDKGDYFNENVFEDDVGSYRRHSFKIKNILLKEKIEQ